MSACQNLTVDGSKPPDLLQVGSGLLDMGAAATAGASFAPCALNFGTQAYTGSLSLTGMLVITNISSKTDQNVLSVDQTIPGPAIMLSQTNTGPIRPGGRVSIDVTMRVSTPQSRGFQGFVAAQSSNGSAPYRIRYWAGLYVPDSSRTLTVAQNQARGDFSGLSDALRSARPGKIIEIADSATYPAGLTIASNNEGLPLHGITVRAKAGQTPVLDGSTNSADFDIHIIGLQNVSLRSLTLDGGGTGVSVSQPSQDVPVSATIDQCTISNTTDSTYGVKRRLDSLQLLILQ